MKIFERILRKKKASKTQNRVLVFPKGTVVKFDGIPCILLQDTPYESAHYRANIETCAEVTRDEP